MLCVSVCDVVVCESVDCDVVRIYWECLCVHGCFAVGGIDSVGYDCWQVWCPG